MTFLYGVFIASITGLAVEAGQYGIAASTFSIGLFTYLAIIVDKP